MACWFCGAALHRPLVERDASIVPRSPAQGGPYLVYLCRACGRTSHVERNVAGAWLAGPPPIVPLAEAVLSWFDRDARAELRRKREHFRRRRGRREWFFGPYAEELREVGWRPPRRGQAAAPPPRPEPGPGPRPRPEPGPEPEPAGAAPPPPEPAPSPPEVTPELTPEEILGVARGASADEVNRAFRDLAKRYHPDRFAGLDPDFVALAEEKFKRIMAARETLLGL